MAYTPQITNLQTGEQMTLVSERLMEEITNTLQRIHHYAAGECGMAPEDRLRLIRRECECELAKRSQ